MQSVADMRFWSMLTFLAHVMIFIIIGIVIAVKSFPYVTIRDLFYILTLYLALNLIRGLVVMLLSPLLSRLGYGFNWRWGAVIVWSGMRGTFTLNMALGISQSKDPGTAAMKNMDADQEIVNEVLDIDSVDQETDAAPETKELSKIQLEVALGSPAETQPVEGTTSSLCNITLPKRMAMYSAVQRIKEMEANAFSMLKLDRFLADANWTMTEEAIKIDYPYKASYLKQYHTGMLNQDAAQTLIGAAESYVDIRGKNKILKLCHHIVFMDEFEYTSYIITLLNFIPIVMDFMTYLDETYLRELKICNYYFIGLYILEASLKALAMRRSYIFHHWNQFELVIIIVGLIDIMIINVFKPLHPTYNMIKTIRVFRIFRLIRVLRLLKMSTEILLQVLAHVDSILVHYRCVRVHIRGRRKLCLSSIRRSGCGTLWYITPWSMPASDPHECCLSCLGESHVKERYHSCKNVGPLTQREHNIHLRALLMQAALRTASEPEQPDAAPSASTSVRSAPLAPGSSQNRFLSLVPKKKPKKMAPSKRDQGPPGKGPCSGLTPTPDPQKGSAPGSSFPRKNPSPIPGNSKGPRPMAQSTASQLLAPGKWRAPPLHMALLGAIYLAMAPQEGKPAGKALHKSSKCHRSPEPRHNPRSPHSWSPRRLRALAHHYESSAPCSRSPSSRWDLHSHRRSPWHRSSS
ncbi:Sodium/hydrogen exchanger 10 [Chelonia mydas]|uniref:Sodium/hydrogen exchanger 10 n=1 Tax=Chelonia mydas TaxID=8469 RepID=M7BN48_CHEMY|nr:Sodium/hydrogen exchanger 10 [Chelonia mydas]